MMENKINWIELNWILFIALSHVRCLRSWALDAHDLKKRACDKAIKQRLRSSMNSALQLHTDAVKGSPIFLTKVCATFPAKAGSQLERKERSK